MGHNVIIRTDASHKIGSGHVMRCLTLADDFQFHGFLVHFICNTVEGHMGNYINERGYPVYLLEDGSRDPTHVVNDINGTIQVIQQVGRPRWLIVDHYALDEQWERSVRAFTEKLMVIDDLADRMHEADVLLDQNASESGSRKYEGLVNKDCQLLIGPSYLLLRPSFYHERAKYRHRSGRMRRILLFFGGSDNTNETEKAIEAIHQLGRKDLQVDIVVGRSNIRIEMIKGLCAHSENFTLHIQVENMAGLISAADFALGSGGVAMWERCFLGLPSSVTTVADNQVDSVEFAARKGVIWHLGWHKQINSGHYADILNRALDHPHQLLAMSCTALELMGSEAGQTRSRLVSTIMNGD